MNAARISKALIRDALAPLNDWLATARPGARLAYAHGYSLGKTPSVIAARMLFDEGEVDLVQARSEGRPGFDYFVVRRATVMPRNHFGFGRTASTAAPHKPRNPDQTPAMDQHDVAMMALLNAAAGTSKPCPTNAELSSALGLKGPDAAAYRLRKLTQAGAIEVVAMPPDRRLIRVVTTGLLTRASM